MLLFLIGIAACSIFIWGACLRSKRKGKARLPPGPRGLPIIGNLHQISKNASTILSQWAKQYGKLYTIHMGNKPTLVINDAILMRQLFGQAKANGKFHSEIFNVVYNGQYGILNTEGKIWHEQRVFFVNALKTVGLGRTYKLECIAIEEIDTICENMENEMLQNGVVYLGECFKRVVSDTLWAIMTEERTKTNISSLLNVYQKSLEKVSNFGLPFFSWIKDIAPQASGYLEFVRTVENLREFLQESFNDPKRVTGQHKDLIQMYIEHSRKMEDKESSFYGDEGSKHGFGTVLSLLMAGMETTSTTMHFLLFYLTVHPEVQTKAQKEIEDIIGEDRDPTIEDRKRMPYLEAVIEETLRRSVAVPFGVILSTMDDMYFHEYTLPKGTLLLPNIYHVLSDPNVWGDPENFRPERFLEGSAPHGTKDKRKMLKDYMVAFQPGKRVCPGEQLARDIIFLFSVKLLKRFTFLPENGRNRSEYMEQRFSYIQLPKTIGVVIKSRE